jgi:hypothetical protein
MNVAMMGGGAAVAVNECSGMLLCQNAEGIGYDNSETWTETVSGSGTINEDYTTTILRGSQSLYLASSNYEGSTVSVPLASTATEVWGHFMASFSASPGDNYNILEIQDSSNNILAKIVWRLAGYFTIGQGTTDANGSTTISSTATRVWFYYKNDGIFRIYLGTSTTRPGTAEVEVTTGNATGSAHHNAEFTTVAN